MFLPMVNRIDLSITQDVFHSIGGHKHTGQIRLDITNFGNLLNNNWGVGQRLVNTQILTSPTADATGKLTYNLQNAQRQPDHDAAADRIGRASSDVYVMMLSFRYTFQ